MQGLMSGSWDTRQSCDHARKTLLVWRERSAELAHLHDGARQYYRAVADVLSISAMTLSAISSSAAVFNGVSTLSSVITISMGGIGVLSTILISMNAFIAPGVLQQAHDDCQKKYSKMTRDITVHMHLERTGTDQVFINIHQFMRYMQNNFDDLEDQAPSIPAVILRRVGSQSISSGHKSLPFYRFSASDGTTTAPTVAIANEAMASAMASAQAHADGHGNGNGYGYANPEAEAAFARQRERELGLRERERERENPDPQLGARMSVAAAREALIKEMASMESADEHTMREKMRGFAASAATRHVRDEADADERVRRMSAPGASFVGAGLGEFGKRGGAGAGLGDFVGRKFVGSRGYPGGGGSLGDAESPAIVPLSRDKRITIS